MARLVPPLVFLILAVLTSSAWSQYQTGGSTPLDPAVKARLDAHATHIRLGLNVDWLRESGIDPNAYAEAVAMLADAVEDGVLPGGVLLTRSLLAREGMPVAVGNRLTDPQAHPAEWDTKYELGGLTGALVVVPVALHLLEQGVLGWEDMLGERVPEFAGCSAGRLTVRDFLTHRTGLPHSAEVPEEVRTREALLEHLCGSLHGEIRECAAASSVNFLLLGLMCEGVTGKPVHVVARELWIEPAGLGNTHHELPYGWRINAAGGSFTEWHGRMVWGEAVEAADFVLGASGGGSGLVTVADDVGLASAFFTVAYWGGWPDSISSATLQLATQPVLALCDATTTPAMGLGFQTGLLGEGSFGWTEPGEGGGSAWWLQPHTGHFVVLLANGNHPEPHLEGAERIAEVLRQVARSLPGKVVSPELGDGDEEAAKGPGEAHDS